MLKIFTAACFCLIAYTMFFLSASASANNVRIGVLAIRGPEDAVKFWQQVADHLNAKIPDHNFIIVPKSYKAMEQAVADQQLEFVVANPAEYIEYEVKYGASRIATQVNHVGSRDSAVLGSVIFTKSNRGDIATLSDLRGKSLIMASKTAFASWLITRDELSKQGISTQDLASVKFSGASADKVIMAVKNGEADVGSVRTLVLEQMAQEGKVALSDFHIINQKHPEDFSFLLSSELYPDFAFARLKHTDRQLADKVAAQLLLMPHDLPTNRYPNLIGWTVPDNYESVRCLLQRWKLPPYEDYGKVTLKEAFKQHWVTVSMGFSVLVAFLLVVFLILNIKQRRKKYQILKEAKLNLEEHNDLVKGQRDSLMLQKAELEAVLSRVRQLEGLIPICMYCKKIRDDTQSWHQLEQYISEHSEADFTHSICPSCLDNAMAEIQQEKEAESENVHKRLKHSHLNQTETDQRSTANPHADQQGA